MVASVTKSVLYRLFTSRLNMSALEARLLVDEIDDARKFDTEVALLAAPLDEGDLAYASDTGNVFVRKSASTEQVGGAIDSSGMPDPYTPTDGTMNIVGKISVRASGGAANSEQYGASSLASGVNATAVAGVVTGDDSSAVGNSALITGDKSSGIGADANISVDEASFVGRLVNIAANGGSVLGAGGKVLAGHINAVAIAFASESTATQRTTIGRVGGTAAQLQDLQVSGGFGANGTVPLVAPSVTGSRGGNAALASLLTTLASIGLITDDTSA
ncbi:hypothetical protein LCGC14_1712820 [marine sediment metagenome]|uniref:Uncharacterized protein n=1 Tax=marine sediment metagenome TaxID=412755 RepID=A0A0F9HF41_9ZZZZ